MSYNSTSAEVADDFKEALQDLTVNDRAQINNLMIIAKENTEHAQAISRELVNHIRTTRPEFKLPALYVLDAIVKFVGTPYTVYLSRDLFRTFMDAYTLMNSGTRRAMDNLLQTWKVPPPESLDTQPVFQPEMTRDIENALIKYRTLSIQHQQQQTRNQRPPQPLPARPNPGEPWRNTPTPPQHPYHQAMSQDPRVRQLTPQQNFGPFTPPFNQPSTPVYGRSQQDPNQPVDPVQLNAEVEKLIAASKAEFVANPTNQDVQKKLKALLDLQSILKIQQLPPEQMKAIQTQVMQLAPTPSPTPNPPSMQSLASLFQRPGSAAPPPTPPIPSTQPHMSLAQLLQPSAAVVAPPNLAQLLQSATPQLSTPQQLPPFPPPLHQRIPGVSTPAAPTPPSGPPAATTAPTLSLAQMLAQFAPQPASTPNPRAPLPIPPPVSQATPIPAASNWLLDMLKQQNTLSATPPAPPASTMLRADPLDRPLSTAALGDNDVELTTLSITKRPRPHLIARLYGALPNQCTTCGRRFANTEQGRSMKSAHMDWHFRVKDPNIAKRGVHRSWYISEREWISQTDTDPSIPSASNGTTSSPNAAIQKAESETYVPVPTSLTLQNAPCPICQERFEKTWRDEANDFVWMDAIEVGGRVYHASCWKEVNRGMSALGGLGVVQQQGGEGTPESVLGKRKAEGEEGGRGKIRV